MILNPRKKVTVNTSFIKFSGNFKLLIDRQIKTLLSVASYQLGILISPHPLRGCFKSLI